LKTAILGISAFFHDSAAVLIIDGELIAAAGEERFTRIKHDQSFPVNAIKYVLQEAGLSFAEITGIAFYEKPLLKFERLLETYHAFVPGRLLSFLKAMPLWIKGKIFIKNLIRRHCLVFGTEKIPIYFPEHHLSHAASAFYPSPFDEAAILTIDGVGEWTTTAISYGKASQIRILRELHFPHSAGLLYSAFTSYLGFKVNSGEYKLMGLSPYGNPHAPQTLDFKNKILAEIVDIREDGSILLNMEYFNFATGLTMTKDKRWQLLFGFPPRKPGQVIGQEHMNLAIAIQEIIESIVLQLARTAKKITNSKRLVLAGGVALNCLANSKLLNAGIFEHIWIQPAASDAGGALGAAYAVYHLQQKMATKKDSHGDLMIGTYLGPQFSNNEIEKALIKNDCSYEFFENFDDLSGQVSSRLASGEVVGWFQGRMEFGPRALGNRSILGDPRNPEMQKNINCKIKFREEFRPFAPSVLEEDVSIYFETTGSSPFMLFVRNIKTSRRKKEPDNYYELNLYERLYHIRSDLPAVTHIDYSSRVQTVSRLSNPKFWQLINDFKLRTGCSMVLNTSFNVRGEPIVCSPTEAVSVFLQTGMDCLAIGNFLVVKSSQQPELLLKHKGDKMMAAEAD